MAVVRGAVGVIYDQDQFLVIRRSQHVPAPGQICFAGGGILPGESEAEALRRELWEELSLARAEPVREVWQSVTARGVHLSWWLTRLRSPAAWCANPAEVADVFWATAQALLQRSDLLESNRRFFETWLRGEIDLGLS